MTGKNGGTKMKKQSIREYAEMVGFEIVGKLTRKVEKLEHFDYCKGKMIVKNTVYWQDEAGNTYTSGCIVTKEGAVV